MNQKPAQTSAADFEDPAHLANEELAQTSPAYFENFAHLAIRKPQHLEQPELQCFENARLKMRGYAILVASSFIFCLVFCDRNHIPRAHAYWSSYWSSFSSSIYLPHQNCASDCPGPADILPWWSTFLLLSLLSTFLS